jgi:tripartite-type tricarboxylate transporter receptor subunit TctC
MKTCWIVPLLALGLAPASASAQSVADFYKGKNTTIVVSTSTGGGYDALARVMARHIGKHIPGHPNVMVRNMPGAGGITATNWLFNSAEKDGTVIGLVQNGTPLEPLFGTKAARYDATKFNWLGTPSYEVSVTLLWHTVPVNSLDDLRKRETSMGATGANSTHAFYTRMLNATLGTKMRVIAGYPGQAEIYLALERGELDGSPGLFYSALVQARPDWLKQNKAKLLLQFGPQRLKELPDVPFATDLMKNEDDRLLMQASSAPQALGRPLMLPPDVPSDRVVAMRKAVADTFNDPAFQADAERIGLIVNAPQTGEQLQKVIMDAYQTPARVVERLRALNNPEK